jgi:hypothetical protein
MRDVHVASACCRAEQACDTRKRFAQWAAALVLAVLAVTVVRAQDLEPRAYSASPIGTNFVVMNYSHLRGDVLTDPSLPIQNIQAKIDLYALGYARTFALAGQTASLALVVPYARAHVSGDVFDAPREVYRANIGDARLRFAFNFIGNPAVSPREFMTREQQPVVGTSLSIVVPTGQYAPYHLINVGTNRWAFRPDVGFSYPVGKWFFESSAGVWLYADNNDFLNGQRRSQDPLALVQVHAGYNFRPGLWLAFDAAHAAGGRTSINGSENDDMQHNSRYGFTLSIPVSTGWSTKLAWSKGFAVRSGGDYDVFSIALQYRWFDR